MSTRLDLGAPSRCLEHAQLRLQLGRVPAVGLEGLANCLRVESFTRAGDVLEAR
jgi:hypothetical protein